MRSDWLRERICDVGFLSHCTDPKFITSFSKIMTQTKSQLIQTAFDIFRWPLPYTMDIIFK